MSDGARAREAARILALAGGDAARAFEVVERQLSVTVVRTQVLLSLSGIVITVTGFSGEAIARVGLAAKASISLGILLVLAAAVTVILGVLRVRWLTQVLTDDPSETLLLALRVRDDKSASLARASWLFAAGFSLYCVAIAQLLLHAR
ncbi:MAG: hypothetical protein IT374_27865 [Polyangiaceae bacterium]|nr:hypothetical protein [Polyangiaceae bacterium]